MLKIRLQRIGRINDPSYRLVVTEHTASPKAGKFVEKVGSYNPKTKARLLAEDRIKHWLSVGAKASGTVHNMLVSAGVISGSKVNVLPKKTVPAVESAKEEAAPAEAVAPKAVPAEVVEEVSTAAESQAVPETPAAPEAPADVQANETAAA